MDAPRVHNRLIFFISSTGDLQKARDVVEQILPDLEIDGSRFESWPASPNPPITECLQVIEKSDGLILLLGSRYGFIDKDSGLSITHLEYRRAKQLNKRIFAYILESPEREAAQARFIEEVKAHLFIRKTPIENLTNEVRASLLQEFTRCFRQVHSYPPESPPPQIIRDPTIYHLPLEPKEAYAFLEGLYKGNNDSAIHQVAAECEARFGQVPEIMNIVYMAEVNYGMEKGEADKGRLQRAITFWDAPDARRRYVGFSLDYNQGNALGVLGRHKEAIEKYRQSLKEFPGHAQCWKNLGTAYIDIGNKSEALKCLEEALRINPLLFEALYSLATLKREEHDPSGALAYLNRIITARLTPDQLSWVQGWKAVTYMEQGLFPDGIAKIEEVLAIRPDWKWAWSLAGRLYSLARHEDKRWLLPAESFWQRFLDKYPEKAEAWAELGFVYWFLRKPENNTRCSSLSLKAFTTAINLGFQDDGLILDRVGHLHQNEGKWTEAENWFRQAANKNPGAFGYCFGVSLSFLGSYEEALPWFKAAAEKHQPDAKSWSQVALCLGNLGRIDEAIIAFQKAISLNPDSPEVWFDLGGLYWNAGNREQAKTIWAEAKIKFPEHPLGEQVDKLLD